ncbi:MAG: MFS transporter [Nitrososphaerota archaeon]|nr:MFS transporter [Nitrososphaerota archaeon]MDG7026149.1 MFS transporter [Nitrososphaerota archaeon]
MTEHASGTGIEALDNAPYRGTLLIVTILTAIGAFTDSYNQFTLTGSTFSLEAYFHTVNSISVSLALFFIGSLLGALLWGRLADVVGRRLVFVIDLVILAVFALLSGLIVTNLLELYTFRFIMGLAAGGDYPAALSLLQEFAPKKLRGRLNSVFWLLFLIAAVIGALVGYWTYTIYGISETQWRVTLASGAIPALLGVILRLGVPESPRWLALKGKTKEASDALRRVGHIMVEPDSIKVTKSTISDLKLFFSKQYLTIAIGLVFAVFFVNFTPGTLGTEAPLVLNAFGFSKTFSLIGSVLFEYIPWVVSGLTVILIGDRVSRVHMFVIGSVGMAIVDFLILVTRSNIYALAASVIAISFLDIFWFNIAMSWAGELYPTRIRGVGAGYGIFLNRTNGALSVFIGPILLSMFHPTGLFVIYGVLGLMGAIGGFVFLGTRGKTEGKSLEAIGTN